MAFDFPYPSYGRGPQQAFSFPLPSAPAPVAPTPTAPSPAAMLPSVPMPTPGNGPDAFAGPGALPGGLAAHPGMEKFARGMALAGSLAGGPLGILGSILGAALGTKNTLDESQARSGQGLPGMSFFDALSAFFG